VHAASVDNGLLVERSSDGRIPLGRARESESAAQMLPSPLNHARLWGSARILLTVRVGPTCDRDDRAFWPQGRREPSPLIPRGPSRAALTLHPHSVRRVGSLSPDRKARETASRCAEGPLRTTTVRAPPRQPPPLTTKALALRGFSMGREGFEPSTLGLRVPCSTN
jgi:hypothetical protein